jgi:hypothetical protein
MMNQCGRDLFAGYGCALIESIPLPTVEQIKSAMQSEGFDMSRFTIRVSRYVDTGHPIVAITPIGFVSSINATISTSGES